ncbi:MAG: response regulator [Planctomycetes bacterium]|nr:response regulator [Planctomycetota bacterium]
MEEDSEQQASGDTIDARVAMVVDDEVGVMNLVARIMEQSHFKVLKATSAEDALKTAGDYEGPIDLLVTDVVMPGMNGYQMSLKMRQDRPSLKVVYMSGFSDNIFAREAAADKRAIFLAKPFQPTMLRKAATILLNTDDASQFGEDFSGT